MTRSSRTTVLGVAAIAVAASGTVGVGISAAVGRSDGHRSSAGQYGGLPAFLPVTTTSTDAPVTSTSAHPALVSEGDTVRIRSRSSRLRMTVFGPVVPGEGLPYQAMADTATWKVTMSDASADLPISIKAFSSIDSLGRVYRPMLVPGQPEPPKRLHPGHTVTFELRTVMAVGEGMMRFAPGNTLLGTWDFVVEND